VINRIGSKIVMGGVGPTSCKMGQLTNSMKLERRIIHTHASEATTPRKVFLHLKTDIFKSL
jgi:hypothetical protein